MTPVEPVVDDLSLSQQRYIEVVDGLMRRHGQVRMTDVAVGMGVSLPSASEAVKRLIEQGLLCRSDTVGVALTPEGRRAANQLDLRHQSLKRFMIDVMAMDPGRADAVACRVEHCVDGDFAERLADLAQLLERDYPWTLRGIADHVKARAERAAPGVDVLAGI